MKAIRIPHPFKRSEVLAIPGIITLRASHDTDAVGKSRMDVACYGVVVCADGDQATIQVALAGIPTPALQGRVPTAAQRDVALEAMEKLG